MLALVAGALLVLGALAVPLVVRAADDDDETPSLLALGALAGVVGMVVAAVAAWLGLR